MKMSPLGQMVFVATLGLFPMAFLLFNFSLTGLTFYIPGVAVILAVLAMPFLIRPAVEKFGPNHCQGCGYALTGLTSDRCPECGKEVPCKAPQSS